MLQVEWEPRAAECCASGCIKMHTGPVQKGVRAALEIAESICEQLGDAGLWFGAREVISKGPPLA